MREGRTKYGSFNVMLRGSGLYVLVREYEIEGRSIYSLPGGGLRKDETEESCAAREAEEESGYVVKVEPVIGEYYQGRSRHGNRLFRKVFLSTIIAGEARPTERHPEIIEVPFDELVALRDQDQLRANIDFDAAHDHFTGKYLERGIGEITISQSQEVIIEPIPQMALFTMAN